MSNWKVKIDIIANDRVSAPVEKINDSLKKIKRQNVDFSKVGASMTRGITLPLVGLGAATIKTSMDFNKSMGKVGTLLANFGQSPALDAIEKLKYGVMDLAKETGKSSSDIAEGLYWTMSAFQPENIGNVSDTMEQMKIVTKAAIAGQTDTASAINMFASVTKAYGDTSKEAFQKVADLTFKANELGHTSFPDLANAMTKVVTIASQMGMSQESLFGQFAALTGITGDANNVAVQLGQILQSLLRPSKAMSAAMKSLSGEGINLFEVLKKDGLLEVMRILENYTGGNTQKMAALFKNVRALRGALGITGPQFDDFVRKFKLMSSAAGSTDRAYDLFQNHVNKSETMWNKLKTNAGALAIKFGEVLLPKFEATIEKLIKLMNMIENTDRSTKRIIFTVIKLAATFGPVLFVTSKLTKGVVGLTKALSGGAGLAGSLPGLITLGVSLGMVIGELIIKFGTWGGHVESITDKIKDLKDAQDRYKELINMTAEEYNKLDAIQKQVLLNERNRLALDMLGDFKELTKLVQSEKEAKTTLEDINEAKNKVEQLEKKVIKLSPGYKKKPQDKTSVYGWDTTATELSATKEELKREREKLDSMNKKRSWEEQQFRTTVALGNVLWKQFGISETMIMDFMHIKNKEEREALMTAIKYYGDGIKELTDETKKNTEETAANTEALDKGKGMPNTHWGKTHVINESLSGRNRPYISMKF